MIKNWQMTTTGRFQFKPGTENSGFHSPHIFT